jgi:hypothetical protein
LELSERRLVNEAGERAANVRPLRATAGEVLDALATACVKLLTERTAVREVMTKD